MKKGIWDLLAVVCFILVMIFSPSNGLRIATAIMAVLMIASEVMQWLYKRKKK